MAARASPNRSRVNILLVDDRPDDLRLLEATLRDLGHCLVTAPSGEAALERLREQAFAVVLLDVHMPGLDGFETARRLRSQERSRYTPIIFLSAHDEAGRRLSRPMRWERWITWLSR